MNPILVALVGLSLSVPVAPLGSDEPSEEPFLADEAGDPAVAWWETPRVEAPLPGRETADLLALEIHETQDHLHVTWVLAEVEPEPRLDTTFYLDFTWGEAGGWIACYRWQLGFGAVYCYLQGDSGARLAGSADADANTIVVEVPKTYVQDDAGRTLEKGVVMHVSAEATAAGFGGPGFSDRAPDEGTAPFELRVGDVAEGALALSASQRVRVSNGGATTLVFQANLSNNAAGEHVTDLTVEGLPEGWSARVPSPVHARPQGETPIVLLVSTPFAHEHGGFSNFTLHARSRTDVASHATLRLGVLHTPVPQPGGHHAELYLHPPRASFYDDFQDLPVWRRVLEQSGIYRFPHDPIAMNTLADHTDERATAFASGEVEEGVHWIVALDPGLAMGLDFRTQEPAQLEGALLDPVGGEGTLAARLLLVPQRGNDAGVDRRVQYDLDAGRVLGEAAVELRAAAGAATEFSLQLPLAEWADLIPHATRQNLVLEIRWLVPGVADRCCEHRLSPALVAEPFRLKLPLDEYHDALGHAAEAAAGLQLLAEGPVERTGRPGTTVTYSFQLRNEGEERVVVDIEASGLHAAAAEVEPREARLDPGQSAKVVLAVRVPAGAAAGHALEVLVHAAVRDDLSRAAVARTLTVVGFGVDAAPDEAAAFAAAKGGSSRDVPLWGAIGIIAAAGVGALLWRRRGRA